MSLPRTALAFRLLRPRLVQQPTRVIHRSLSNVSKQSSRRSPFQSQNLSLLSVRYHSTPSSISKLYEFSEIKSLSANPSPSRILIDVREPSEYEQGYIPSALNVPVKSQPDALFLPEEEFEERFGFEKPGKDQEVIFYCRSGVRSNAAAQLAAQNGYEKVGEYRGSWLDWEKNSGAEK